jgi:hypothetical protein
MSAPQNPSRPFLVRCGVALAALIALSGCYRVRSQLVASPVPPDDLYTCAQLELGRAGYAIVGADRASGWLHAQKRTDSILTGLRIAEIYVTVIPEESVGGSQLQLSDNSHAEDDADRLRATCAPADV